jgi:hypothetical protein
MRLRNGRSTTCGSAHAHARRDRARTRARYARTRRHGDRSCDDLERAVPLSVNPETTTTMNDNLGIVQADSVRADFHTDGAHFTVSRVVLARPMFVPSHARRASCTRADACAVWQCTLSTNHHCRIQSLCQPTAFKPLPNQTVRTPLCHVRQWYALCLCPRMPGEQVVPERMPVLYGSANRAIQYGVRRHRYCVTCGSGTSISSSGCTDAIGQPITDADQAYTVDRAYTAMLSYMVPSSMMTESDILPALTFLTRHFTTGTVHVSELHTVTYNLRQQMKRLNWGFFDQAICEEICAQHIPAHRI